MAAFQEAVPRLEMNEDVRSAAHSQADSGNSWHAGAKRWSDEAGFKQGVLADELGRWAAGEGRKGACALTYPGVFTLAIPGAAFPTALRGLFPLNTGRLETI